MRLFWHSTPGNIPSGYGVQTRLFTRALKALGHEVIVSATCGTMVNERNEDGIMVTMVGPNVGMMGNDLFPEHVEHFKPDVVLSMVDPFVCKPELFNKVNWYPWVMIHEEPMDFRNAAVLRACLRPIGPTPRAVKYLQDAGFSDPFLCPLMFDPDEFSPFYRSVTRDTLRTWVTKNFNCEIGPDTFIVCAVTQNNGRPCRKNHGAMYEAWSLFHAAHPDSVFLHVTDESGYLWQGEALRKVRELYKCEAIHYPDQYTYNTGMLDSAFLRCVYNAADAYLCTSQGEGFCLPLVEAQACGCRVIIPDFGCMLDVVGPDAIRCAGRKYMHSAGSVRFAVDPAAVAKALAWALSERDQIDRDDVAKHVQKFTVNAVTYNYLRPMLEQIECEIDTPKKIAAVKTELERRGHSVTVHTPYDEEKA